MAVRKPIALMLAIVGLALLAAPAQASYHLMKISEVSGGSADDSGDFIELQMFSGGQNFLTGHNLFLYDAGGLVLNDIPLTMVSGPAPSQATVLIGDASGIAGGVSADIAAPPPFNVPEAGGAVCFPDAVPPDCVAWGNFAGPLPAAVGANAPALVAGQSLTRSIAPGCATLLEEADDSDNSAADLALTIPSPRPFTVAPTETPCGGGPGPGGGGADNNPPETSITKAPKRKSAKGTVKIAFESSEQGSKFKCKLDKGKFESCGSPFKAKVKLGKHGFEVFAIDGAGNEDKSPAKAKFKRVEKR